MDDPRDHLTRTLKSIRRERRLSLDQTAEATGVSKAMLGQIERGESSPTIATLWKIATGLGVSLTAFLAAVPDNSHATLIRDADVLRHTRSGDGMQIAALFPFEPHLGFEYLELTFEPGYERLSGPHQIGVMEILTLISGQMEVMVDGIWHLLTPGQSIRFAGDKRHGYRNLTLSSAKAINLIHYPSGPQIPLTANP